MKNENCCALELTASEADLLIWNIPNEVLNGFRIEEFDENVGSSKVSFSSMSVRLRASLVEGPLLLAPSDAKVLRNALSLTLIELGEDEFETRSGHEFTMGLNLIAALDQFLG